MDRLNAYEGLRVITGPTSTVIVGDYGIVMRCLSETMEWSHREHGRSVFIAKLIPDYDAK